jgi:hypothetical protein
MAGDLGMGGCSGLLCWGLSGAEKGSLKESEHF